MRDEGEQFLIGTGALDERIQDFVIESGVAVRYGVQQGRPVATRGAFLQGCSLGLCDAARPGRGTARR